MQAINDIFLSIRSPLFIGWLALFCFLYGTFLIFGRRRAAEDFRWLPLFRSITRDFMAMAVFYFPLVYVHQLSLGFLASDFWGSAVAPYLQGPANQLSGGPAMEFVARITFCLGLFFTYEFAWYLSHFLLHHVPVLWPFHRIHHSASQLTPFTNIRNHVVEYLVRYACIGPLTLLTFLSFRSLGFPALGEIWFLSFAACLKVLDNLRHCDWPLSFGPLNKIVISPAQHQLHHSRQRQHFGKNLGYNLAVFDRVFGTDFPVESGQRLEFGTEGSNAEATGFIHWYFIEPIRECRKYVLSGQIFRFRRGT